MISETTKAEWRALFPVTRNLTYFNHAAVGPLSTRAFDAMQRHAVDQREFGATHWRDWYAEYELLRASAGRLIGAAPDEIAILKNTSEGVSFVAEGLEWERGDNVVTTDLEFPSNFTPSNWTESACTFDPVWSHTFGVRDESARRSSSTKKVMVAPLTDVPMFSRSPTRGTR